MSQRCDGSQGVFAGQGRVARSARARVGALAALLVAAGLTTSLAQAQQTAGKPETPSAPPIDPESRTDFSPPSPNAVSDAPDPEQPEYLVGAFVVRYATQHPQFPALDDLNAATVTLGRNERGFVTPGGGVPTVTYTLEELATQPAQRYTSGALNLVGRAVLDEIMRYGLMGVRVTLSDREFAPRENPGEGEPPFDDLRPRGQLAVTLEVGAVRVREVRSVAFGPKVPFEERINNPRYERIVANSPVQPFVPDDEQRADLLRTDVLDDYVFRLNRHPGRRVDLGIAAATQDNELILDYYISENKPWLVYGQVSNTGTKQTDEWRERFGFSNNQLTNSDDILSIDYITASFDKSHALNISYDRPIWGDWLRGRVFGSYSEYTASDVGATGADFEGESWSIGGELVGNVFQRRDWFVDAYAGARWENISNDPSVGIGASDDFFLTNVGARLSHNTDVQSLEADVGFEIPFLDVSDTEKANLGRFGRLSPSTDWLIFQWSGSYSFYLEPLLRPSRWRNWDPENPSTWPVPTHEMFLGLRGQYAFDDRLIPNYQQVAGGMYTVRGYPESIVAGDSLVIGTVEYRFHLPQALGFERDPKPLFGTEPFRWKPQGPYGRADWDLILKAFVDAARVDVSRAAAGEQAHTLVGTGIGAEFVFRRNFNLRIDWGVALEEVQEADNPDFDGVSSGSNRFHISATILF